MPFTDRGVESITGRQTTAGVAEEEVLIVVDGAPAILHVPVPGQHRLVISDWIVGSADRSLWRIQQSNDGLVFFDIALAEAAGNSVESAPQISYNTPLVIVGGPDVRYRVLVRTPDAIYGALVYLTIRATEQSLD